MSKKKNTAAVPRPAMQLPKNALSKINLGDSFAEYDSLLQNDQVFVSTNAFLAAQDATRNKCFFIGRRGTGKTAITIQLARSPAHTLQIFPELFGPLNSEIDPLLFKDAHLKPFKSISSAFELSLQFELLYYLIDRGKISTEDLPDFACHELKIEDNRDFDLRTVRFVGRILKNLHDKKDVSWLKDIKKPKTLANAINRSASSANLTSILIDRIDDSSWEGTDLNVRFLSALMHACGEMTTRVTNARAMLFLRENVFERVRRADSEFARIETRVVGLTWTEEKLLEFVERRLNVPFNTKWPLGGPTWSAFFDAPEDSKKTVFDFCQSRPRDVLTYVKFAIENAVSKNHVQIQIDDLLAARKRFSDSRLKDLGDEYDENFPRIQLVLDKFYGLGWRFTRQGIESLLTHLMVADDIRQHCATWFFANSTTELFVNLLFQIGFIGIIDERGISHYRSIGAETTATPAISAATDFEIHPMYRDALDLQDTVVNASANELKLGSTGLIEEFPDDLDLTTYTAKLTGIEDRLSNLEHGRADAYAFEDIVGEVIKLCFFRSLANVQSKARTFQGHQIRDWIASNRGYGGFWELVRHKWNATQIIWECKNYEELGAEDFHQVQSYMNDDVGRFGIIVFRGEVLPKYWPHLNSISKNSKGFVLLLNDRDLKVFIRQAKAGKVKEAHIQDRYDHIERSLG